MLFDRIAMEKGGAGLFLQKYPFTVYSIMRLWYIVTIESKKGGK